MNKKFGVSWIIVVFIVGVFFGAAGGALFVTWKVIRFETDAIASAVAETTFSMVPPVAALNGENEEERLKLFESAARTRLNGGVLTLHASLPMLSEEKRVQITNILISISRNREKLALGRFESPPRDHIEEILAIYSK